MCYTSPLIALCCDKGLYTKHLRYAKDLGFNFARHHSTVLPIEFWDAACEVGLFMSAQFPIGESSGNSGFEGTCPGDGCNGMLLHEWRAMVKQLRNHPCVFDYVRGHNRAAVSSRPAVDLFRGDRFLL